MLIAFAIFVFVAFSLLFEVDKINQAYEAAKSEVEQ